MISLIMPFWNRQEAWNKSLRLLAAAYPKLDMEVICVSDGSPCEQQVETPFPVRIYHLPEKPSPLSPCVPHNVAVAFARGEIILLTNPEILHEKPILEELREELEKLGPKGFALASVWCPEQNMWHCHSTRAGSLADGWGSTVGACFWFCGMLYREFFYEAGGLDEIYRLGAGYEDGDFNKRCEIKGAKFSIRDDLVVVHPKTGARTPWPDGAFARNKAIFAAKWQPKLNVVCLKWGDKYGPEYVNRLFEAIRKNLPDGFEGRFLCFTDDANAVDGALECRPIPEPGLSGWWGKLSLFKRGVFPDGERVVYFDLDTVISGDLEQILSYNGPFAILRDFYRPEGYGSGVMAWEAGKVSHIWETYEAASRASGVWQTIEGGDQAWIEKTYLDALRLQDIFRGSFVSFKTDCENGPPKDARVVCFHGEPKPDNCGAEWIRLLWEKGMILPPATQGVSNSPASVVQDNILSACKRDLPWLKRLPPNNVPAVFVAGGPSTRGFLSEIKERQSLGQLIVSMNGSFYFLKRNGIIADWHVVMDARPENIKFVAGVRPRVGILLSSQCHPALFDCLNGSPAEIFHNYTSLAVGLVERTTHFVGGGNTVGLAALAAFYSKGHREMALFGYDSSYDETRHHAYAQALNNKEKTVEAVVCGKTFITTGWMVDQVNQFQELAIQLANADCVLTVHGEGLLPTVAREMQRQLQGDSNG